MTIYFYKNFDENNLKDLKFLDSISIIANSSTLKKFIFDTGLSKEAKEKFKNELRKKNFKNYFKFKIY